MKESTKDNITVVVIAVVLVVIIVFLALFPKLGI